ncbi:MAG: response regulator, partial [Rubrivivax sp.]|nr:response regulator [Rubrivivax sp.]
LVATEPGWRLLGASSPEQGIGLARTKHPVLVLLDIRMPGLDGYAVLQALRADAGLAGVPVIAVSASAMPVDIARGRAAGFDDYLTKPLDLQRLRIVIDRLLAR